MKNRLLLNLERVRSSSGDPGFVLSDALISLSIVSIMAVLVLAAVQSLSVSKTALSHAYEESEGTYEETLAVIGECVCEEAEESEDESEEECEDPWIEADTSWNSF